MSATASEKLIKELSQDPNVLTELGTTGLEQYGGLIHEEFLRKLQGRLGILAFREMELNDPIIGAMLYALEMLLRSINWTVEPYEPGTAEGSEDDQNAKFIEEVYGDMAHSWAGFIGEWMAAPVYGFASFEICWKKREGYNRNPNLSSKFTDGRIGVSKLAIRHPVTLHKWHIAEDEDERVLAMEQLHNNKRATIPAEKLLLFTTLQRKGNPEGTSLLRRCFLPYYRKKHIEEIEGIGIERELNGLPMMSVPLSWFATDATANEVALLTYAKKLVRRVKSDEQMGLVVPRMLDEHGNELFKFELLATNGRRAIDTGPAKDYYSRQMAMSILMDVIMLGHEKVGSYALAQPLDSNVLTPMGWKRMGDIQPGDEVICPTGEESHVIDTYDHGLKDTYQITFADGRMAEASADHKWVVTCAQWKCYEPAVRRNGLNWEGEAPELTPSPEYAVVTTEQLATRLREVGTETSGRFHIPTTNPVEFTPVCPHCGATTGKSPLPVDPYILGVILGDGNIPKERGTSSGGPTITTMDKEIVDAVRARLPADHRLKVRNRQSRATNYKISGPRRAGAGKNEIVNALDELGLIGCTASDKFVPDRYLYAAIVDRIALVRGLMDTDGHASKQGQAYFSTISPGLRDGMIFLVRSLGGTASTYTRRNNGYVHPKTKQFIERAQTTYRVTINLPDQFNPFLLTRKAGKVRPEEERRSQHTGIVSIEKVGVKEMRCIAVSSASGMYVTDDFVPTHNSSSKTSLMGISVGALLDGIEDVHNRDLIPRLMELNGLDPARCPRVKHGDIETPDLEVLGTFVTALAGAGFQLFPTKTGDLERTLLRAANLPEDIAAESAQRFGEAEEMRTAGNEAMLMANEQATAGDRDTQSEDDDEGAEKE